MKELFRVIKPGGLAVISFDGIDIEELIEARECIYRKTSSRGERILIIKKGT